MGSGKIIEKSGIKTIAEAKAARAAKQAEIIENPDCILLKIGIDYREI